MAEQGQRYRVTSPSGKDRTVIGQGNAPDRYTSTITINGKKTIVEDIIGDVINASENVEYPHGANPDYRHVDWIEEHPDRFELIEE